MGPCRGPPPLRAAPATDARPPVAGTKRYVRACRAGLRPSPFPRGFLRTQRPAAPGPCPALGRFGAARPPLVASARAPRLWRSAARRAFALPRALAARAALLLALAWRRASVGRPCLAAGSRCRSARDAGSPSGRPFGLRAGAAPAPGRVGPSGLLFALRAPGLFFARAARRAALLAASPPTRLQDFITPQRPVKPQGLDWPLCGVIFVLTTGMGCVTIFLQGCAGHRRKMLIPMVRQNRLHFGVGGFFASL